MRWFQNLKTWFPFNYLGAYSEFCLLREWIFKKLSVFPDINSLNWIFIRRWTDMGRSSPRSRLKGHLLGTSGAPQGHLQGTLDVPKVSQNLAAPKFVRTFWVHLGHLRGTSSSQKRYIESLPSGPHHDFPPLAVPMSVGKFRKISADLVSSSNWKIRKISTDFVQ